MPKPKPKPIKIEFADLAIGTRLEIAPSCPIDPAPHLVHDAGAERWRFNSRGELVRYLRYRSDAIIAYWDAE